MNRNNSESVARADPGFRVLGLRYILQKKKKNSFDSNRLYVIRLIENDCKRKQAPDYLSIMKIGSGTARIR